MAWLPQPLVAADYMPDMPSLNNPGSNSILNALPRTEGSYGPFPSLSTYGGALTARCQGAFACSDSSSNHYIFAGDATKLYDYTSASTTPNDLSQSGNYNCPSDAQWHFSVFGQRVVATDFVDPIQSYVLGVSSKFADLANGNVSSLTIATPGTTYTNGTNYALVVTGGGGSGFAGLVDVVGGAFTNARITTPGKNYTSTPTVTLPAGAGAGSGTASITCTITTIAPKAKYTDIAKGFLIAGYTSDATSGVKNQRVWWSAYNDPTNWPTPGTALAAAFQSSFNDLYDAEGGDITGIVGNLGGCDVAVFFEHQVWRGVYAGPPVIFDFFPAEGVRGTTCPNSIIHLGPFVYYLGEDGFYVFDGSSSKPIGANRVDKTFYTLFDQTYSERVWGAADPVNKIVYWLFPGTDATNGVPNHIIMYNWVIDKWSFATVTSEVLFRSLTFGVTLDTLPGTLNSYNSTLDSRQWTGIGLTLGGFDGSHKLAFFNGSSLQATIETSESAPFDYKLAFINNTRPLVDGSTPTVAVATRNRLIDMPTYGASSTINSLGLCPLTANGRYVKAQVTIPAAGSWTHFQGVEINAVPNGEM